MQQGNDMNTQTQPLRGQRLAKAVINQILAKPETWDQGHCYLKGVSCFGHIRVDDKCLRYDCKELEQQVSDWLINDHRTLPELYFFAKHWRIPSPEDQLPTPQEMKPFEL